MLLTRRAPVQVLVQDLDKRRRKLPVAVASADHRYAPVSALPDAARRLQDRGRLLGRGQRRTPHRHYIRGMRGNFGITHWFDHREDDISGDLTWSSHHNTPQQMCAMCVSWVGFGVLFFELVKTNHAVSLAITPGTTFTALKLTKGYSKCTQRYHTRG